MQPGPLVLKAPSVKPALPVRKVLSAQPGPLAHKVPSVKPGLLVRRDPLVVYWALQISMH